MEFSIYSDKCSVRNCKIEACLSRDFHTKCNIVKHDFSDDYMKM